LYAVHIHFYNFLQVVLIMPVHIQWDNADKTIILHQYEGEVSTNDYLHAINRTFQMLNSVPHTVHLIYDRSGVTGVPQQMSRIFQVAGKYLTENIGIKVVVGANLTTTINLQLCRVIAPGVAKNTHFANSVNEARQLIAAHDPGLQARV
jgi:hypothetical protein